MIASDAVEHGEDEEPHAGNDENGVKHEILHADQMRTLTTVKSVVLIWIKQRRLNLCVAQEMTRYTYKFEIDLIWRLYRTHIRS